MPVFHADPYDASGTRYPRDEESGHNYRGISPPARQSTDEVSWDMNATRVARAEHSYASPLASSTETVQQGEGGYSPLNPLRPLVNPFEDPSRDHSPGPLPIPTHSSNSTPRLSSPYEHAQELPNAAYTTALTNSPVSAPPRALSPPPPSYQSTSGYIQ
jgi:hypothetical protein